MIWSRCAGISIPHSIRIDAPELIPYVWIYGNFGSRPGPLCAVAIDPTGSLPGTASLLVRRWDGLSWAVLFNQRSEDDKLPDTAIDPALHRAAQAVGEWPAHDLFEDYG